MPVLVELSRLAAERKHFPHEVAEMALAHTVGDKVEAAHRPGNLLQKRRRLMEACARFCGTKRIKAEVVPFSGSRKSGVTENRLILSMSATTTHWELRSYIHSVYPCLTLFTNIS